MLDQARPLTQMCIVASVDDSSQTKFRGRMMYKYLLIFFILVGMLGAILDRRKAGKVYAWTDCEGV